MRITGKLQEQTPWFERYRREFYRMLGFSELETFDHPVACASLAEQPPHESMQAASDI